MAKNPRIKLKTEMMIMIPKMRSCLDWLVIKSSRKPEEKLLSKKIVLNIPK